MRKLLLLILLLPLFAKAQNTVTLPTPTTAYTPQFRYYGAANDTLKNVYMFSGSVYNQIYTATQIAKLFRTPNSIFTRRMDSLFALSAKLSGGNNFTGTQTINGAVISDNTITGLNVNATNNVTANYGMITSNLDVGAQVSAVNLSLAAGANRTNFGYGNFAGGITGMKIYTPAVSSDAVVIVGSNIYGNNIPFLKAGDVPSDSTFNARVDSNITVNRTNLVSFLGDSMTAQGKSVDVLDSLLGTGWDVSNLGIGGAMVYGMNLRLNEITNTTAPYVILRGGINDIVQGRTSTQVIADIQSIVTTLKTAGKYVIVSTITPFNGNVVYTSGREAYRVATNTAIKTTITGIDYVIDADALLKDPADSSKLNIIYDSGDHLHQNDLGYTLFSNTVYSNVAFTKDTSKVTISASKSVSLDQDLGTFSDVVHKSVSALNLNIAGTNATGTPSILTSTSHTNNPSFVAKYSLSNQAVPFAQFRNYQDSTLISIDGGTNLMSFTPKADGVTSVYIKDFSNTPSGAPFRYVDYLGVDKAKININGVLSISSVANITAGANGLINFNTTGVEANRNTADASSVFEVRQLNSTATGALQKWRNISTYTAAMMPIGLGLGTQAPNASLQVGKNATGLGTISTTASGTTVTGVGTDFTNRFKIGQTITANGETHTVSAIASNTSMTTDAWTNTNTNVAHTATFTNTLRAFGNGNLEFAGYPTQGGIFYTSTTAGLLAQSAAITGLVKGNGTSAPTVAVSNTDYLPVASPVMTGTPTAPTAAATTLTTQIATTAFTGALQNYTASGTGAATTITIAHGLTGITGTSKVIVQPLNAASSGISYCTIDATNVSVIYTIAPALGTNNLNYSIHIKP